MEDFVEKEDRRTPEGKVDDRLMTDMLLAEMLNREMDLNLDIQGLSREDADSGRPLILVDRRTTEGKVEDFVSNPDRRTSEQKVEAPTRSEA